MNRSIVSRSSGMWISQIASGSMRPKSLVCTSKIPMCLGRTMSLSVIWWRLRPLPACGTVHVPAGQRGVRHLSVA